MIRRKTLIYSLLLVFLLLSCGPANPGGPWPSRIILFIGDGMGPEQARAGEYYMGHSASFADFPVHALVATHSASSAITDSAAAATAIATGFKVNNGVLSVALPGSGRALETVLEKASSLGMLTGLATTVYLTHATPAAFGAHQTSRTLYDAIADDYLYGSRPNVMLGGGANGLDDTEALGAGYAVVKNLVELESAGTVAEPFVAGLFGTGSLQYESLGGPHTQEHPDLVDMTVQALRLLEVSGTGFFLMVESGLIDQAAHLNDAEMMVGEVAVLDRAVSAALSWAADKNDVLIIVTADHETGGISGVVDNGEGLVPTVSWTTTGHSSRSVDLFAWGFRSEPFADISDNTQLHSLLLE